MPLAGIAIYPVPAHRRSLYLVHKTRIDRRIVSRRNPDSGSVCRLLNLNWRIHELELHDEWRNQFQPANAGDLHSDCHGVENSRLVGAGSLAAPALGTPWRPGRVFIKSKETA